MTERARRIRTRLVAAFVAVLVLNVALAAANELLPSGRVDGDPGSSYVTTPEGTAAWFELLARTDRQPSRLTTPISAESLEHDTTLVLIEVAFVANVDEVVKFVEEGGQLVATTPHGGLGEVGEAFLEGRAADVTVGAGDRFTASAVVQETAGVSTVVTEGRQAWTTDTEAEGLLVDDEGRSLAIALTRGAGSVVLVADPTVFSNAHLAQADNAAFAVSVLKGRPAVFDEYSHGYIDDLVTEPLLPRSWRWTLYLLGAATVLFLIAMGTRLGPPERATRPLPPPRRWFVESLANVLGRTEIGQATEPLRQAARSKLAQRGGLAPDASLDELATAAVNLGIRREDVWALGQPATDDESAMAIGRVMALAHGLRQPADSLSGANVPGELSEEAPV